MVRQAHRERVSGWLTTNGYGEAQGERVLGFVPSPRPFDRLRVNVSYSPLFLFVVHVGHEDEFGVGLHAEFSGVLAEAFDLVGDAGAEGDVYEFPQ